MKLPEEVKAKIPKLELEQYDLSWLSIEAIVRDCAEVCLDKSDKLYDHAKPPYIDMAKAILTRYGLETT